MILLRGGAQMTIEKVSIKKLYGEYNYEIIFDSELTFLYGYNGCGKTTVLNILSSIVTGKLYNLVEYRFDEIILHYISNNGEKEQIKLKTLIEENDKRRIKISFKEGIYDVEDIDGLKERLFRKAEDENIERIFFSMYPFAEQLKKIFNYIYLPLNRYGNDAAYRDGDYYRYMSRRHYYFQQQNSYNTYLNESLQYIAGLIRDSCMNMNVQENRINDKFRTDVLSSSIRVSSDMPIGKILDEIENCEWKEVLKSKEAYIKTLTEIGVYNDNLKLKIEQFFEEFKKAYDDYQSRRSDKGTGIRIDLAWQYAEFLKIKNIADLAKEYEKRKETIRRPKELFITVINDFFETSGTDKKVQISSDGQVFFETHGHKLSLKDLSSGEKQLIITFASLIFALKGKTKGIFIVDEPEASLHLEWQAKFVSSILKTNKNLQLIFATHSPELMGEYAHKAVKLVRV